MFDGCSSECLCLNPVGTRVPLLVLMPTMLGAGVSFASWMFVFAYYLLMDMLQIIVSYS